jgi:signal transduction histidine kinase
MYSNGYGKQVPITYEVAPDMCDAVITDEEWLWQMLLNLLTNACKYTDRGSIAVRIQTTTEDSEPETSGAVGLLRISIPKKNILFEVIDTGMTAPTSTRNSTRYCRS